MRRFFSMRTLCAAAIAALLTSNLFLASCSGEEDYEMNGEYTLAEGRMTRSEGGVMGDITMIKKQECISLGNDIICSGIKVRGTISWERGLTASCYATVNIHLPSDSIIRNNEQLPKYALNGQAEGLIPLANHTFRGSIPFSYYILSYNSSGQISDKKCEYTIAHIDYTVSEDMFFNLGDPEM